MADKQVLSMHIEGLKELQDDFRKAGAEFEGIMKQAMVKSTTKIQNDARNNIRENGTTFQGGLARSVRVREATASYGLVAVGEKYGGAVEFGRKPGKQPPVAPLERWAALKLGSPGAGFVIARKIGKKGTKPQPFFEPAFTGNVDYVLDQFKQAVSIIVQRMAGA